MGYQRGTNRDIVLRVDGPRRARYHVLIPMKRDTGYVRRGEASFDDLDQSRAMIGEMRRLGLIERAYRSAIVAQIKDYWVHMMWQRLERLQW